ncbi:CopG family antitoxin [Azotobacter vinelandii]|uniref:CopG family antitoxin n=1 Tax=Azotobacter vinelandii TaxID=354 RepID=UPI0007734BA9|nr:CopG family antitoxin [Azotobacter vinelandii]
MKRVPDFKTDAEAEAFLEQDLSDLDFKQFKPMHFEFEPKSASLTIRLPQPLLDALKVKAKAQGIPYTRYVQRLLENDLTR